MEISENGLSIIKQFEGCILHPYLDQGGKPTIGWGMTYYPDTGKIVTMSDKPLTQIQADALFALMVKPYCTGVIEALGGTVVNQNQFDSLVDFCYNLGVGAFKQSTLCQHIKYGTVLEADFTLYDHVKGQISVDLLNRRKAEYQLFIKPINIMDETNVVAEVQAVPQTVVVKSITVTFDRTENGAVIQTDGTTTVKLTPELLAALALPDAELIEAGFNVTVAA